MFVRFFCILALLALVSCGTDSSDPSMHTLRGSVASGGKGLQGYKVSLIARYVGTSSRREILGQTTTDPSGNFSLPYRLKKDTPSASNPILFVQAERGPVLLVSTLKPDTNENYTVITEQTTVATATAFAQFVEGKFIDGNQYGMQNAVFMAANMADPRTGAAADVLRLPPNGPDTTTQRLFNSLANIIAGCVASDAGCLALFKQTTLPGGTPPKTVLQAVANIAKYPWLHVPQLFGMSFNEPVYAPALGSTESPAAWSVFLKFTGSFSSEQNRRNLMNGPGAFAIDEKGFIWINDNYTPAPPLGLSCAGERLIKLYPWGENFPNSPYFGGGLSGAGFGISIAPNGLIWVGNFGFFGVRAFGGGSDGGGDADGSKCKNPPQNNSVSVFLKNGQPVPRGENGFTNGAISWPQATNPDREGNIWLANCGSDSVTIYPDGKPSQAFNVEIPVPPSGPRKNRQMKPFGLALDHLGNAWVTGNFNSTLAVIGPKGQNVDVIHRPDQDTKVQISRPMGIASDSRGNMWVANSDWVDVPCGSGTTSLGPGTAPTVALFPRDNNRRPYRDSPFNGGGLTVPWGIAVDGNDTVWVANFGFPFGVGPRNRQSGVNRVSHFCGMDTSKCPPSKQTVGQAISPDVTGYMSDSLVRNTGLAIDPSGNVWLANNWKKIPLQGNPGGNSVVVMVGAAGPLKTPLIGTPVPFER